MTVFFGYSIDIVNSIRLAGSIYRNFTDHGVSDDVQVAGFDGGRDENGGGLEIGFDGATTSAAGGIVAGETAVERLGQDGQVRRDDRDAERLAVLLDEQFVRARAGRWLEDARWRIGGVFETFVRAKDTDERLGLDR